MFFLGQRFQGIRVSLYIYERTYFTSKKKAILYMFILRLALYDINLFHVSVVFIWTDHCFHKLCLSLFHYCRLSWSWCSVGVVGGWLGLGVGLLPSIKNRFMSWKVFKELEYMTEATKCGKGRSNQPDHIFCLGYLFWWQCCPRSSALTLSRASCDSCWHCVLGSVPLMGGCCDPWVLHAV